MSNAADNDCFFMRLSNLGHFLFFLAICCSITIGCAQAPPVAKIGLVAPFTGKHRDVGYDVIYSARLAVREINEVGGIGRHRVALVAMDDFGDPVMAEKNALALSNDPGVVAIIGHWLPETTQPASTIYESGKIPFVATGEEPLGYQDPALLPIAFGRAYADITPFDEIAGPYAGSGFDAIQLVLAAMKQAEDDSGTIDRLAVSDALKNLTIDGLTGPVFQR